RGGGVRAAADTVADGAGRLAGGQRWDQVTGFSVASGQLVLAAGNATLALADPGQFAGYRGDGASPSAVLLANNGLHLEIQVDAGHPIGRDDPAHIKELVLESAVSTIQDCEDSVAAVAAADKVEPCSTCPGRKMQELTAT